MTGHAYGGRNPQRAGRFTAVPPYIIDTFIVFVAAGRILACYRVVAKTAIPFDYRVRDVGGTQPIWMDL